MTVTFAAAITLADVEAAKNAIGPRPANEYGPEWAAHQDAWDAYISARTTWEAQNPRIFDVTISSPALEPWRFQVTAPNQRAALGLAAVAVANRQDPEIRITAAPALVKCGDCAGSGRSNEACGCKHGCAMCDYTGRSVFACKTCGDTGEIAQPAIPANWPA